MVLVLQVGTLAPPEHHDGQQVVGVGEQRQRHVELGRQARVLRLGLGLGLGLGRESCG